MDESLGSFRPNGVVTSEEERDPAWVNSIAVVIWFTAAAVAFLPFAFDTSPWDAVRLHVPDNQGNWWHLLAGLPFFLAYPLLWLRARALFAARLSTARERRLIWCAIALCVAGTIGVEAPFLLHLAGTSDWQRLSILSLGFGILIGSAIVLFLRRDAMAPTQACIAGLATAYLANVALCLVVYAGATGNEWSRAGWLVSAIIVWPIVLDLAWNLMRGARAAKTRQRRPVQPSR
jgi:hypothetical protein